MPEPYPDKELLTAKEVCHLLSFERSTFYRWLKEEGKDFPKPVSLGAKTKRWKKSQVLAFIHLLSG